MRGYDLDGTLCVPGPKREKSFFKQTGIERRAHEAKVVNHYKTAKKIREPEAPYIIATGRKEKYREETIEWLKSNVTVQPIAVVMLTKGRNADNMIELKIDACLKYDVAVYYEDDLKIARALADAGINVIKV